MAAENIYHDPRYRFLRVVSAFEEVASISETTRWLDLGCHQGQFLKLLIDKYGLVATGVDDWDESLSRDKSWKYIRRDLSLQFDLKSQFDCISALEVIEHVVDTDAFLERCRAHLIADGYFALSTPNINSLRNRIGVPLGAYPVGPEYRNTIHHVRLYNLRVLACQLEEHGFQVITIRGVSLLPQRTLKHKALRVTSEFLANRWPQLCGNLIVIAQKR